MHHHLKSLTRALSRDDGVAGVLIAILVSIAAFSALAVFMSKYVGPHREITRLQRSDANAGIVQEAIFAYLNVNGTLPCPDTGTAGDGTADTCNSSGTTAGTLPWRTLGLSREDAVDGYGTFFSYIVSATSKDVCVSVGNDYDSSAAREYTGEYISNTELEVRTIGSTDGTGAYLPFVVFSHGPNKLGGISSSGTAYGNAVTGSSEAANNGSAPTDIFTGPYNTGSGTSYFDDVVYAPTVAKLQAQCEGNTESGQMNTDLIEPFNGAIDTTKLATSATTPPTYTTNSSGSGVARFSATTSYLVSASTFRFAVNERPVYISTEWTPDPLSSGATTAGFSIVTRSGGDPTSDPGITFRFGGGTISSGGTANSLDILNDNTSVTPVTSGTFSLITARTYRLEVYDNGSSVWMKITQTDDPDNTAWAYELSLTADYTGHRIVFVNGANTVSYIDNVLVGTPMLAMDTFGTGYAATTVNNRNGTSTGEITLEGWFKPTTLPGSGQEATLISQWNSNSLTSSSFRLYMGQDGALSISLGDGTTTDTEALGVSLIAGEWAHLAITYDGAGAGAGTLIVYKNGSRSASLSNVLAGAAIRSPNTRFAVGANYDGTTYINIYDGLVADVRVWDAVRTATNITTWYNHRLPLAASATDNTGLVVNWRFDLESGGFGSGSVDRAPDTSGNNDADGALGGTTVARFVAARRVDFRTISSAVCGPGMFSTNGNRIGAYRCDFREDTSGSGTYPIPGEDLGGLATLYVKAWGGGSGVDSAGPAAPYDGGGGGFAGGLFLNSGANLSIDVGAGSSSASNPQDGGDTVADQGSTTITGAGATGNNNSPGTAGGGSASNTLNSETGSGSGRLPGCIPAISSEPDACTDVYYATTGGPESLPGYGGDAPGTYGLPGRDGVLVLLW